MTTMFQIRFITLTIACAILLTACNKVSPEAKEANIQKQIELANAYLGKNKAEQAIELMESLSETHPNNPVILETLAFSYAKKPDAKLAAFYFMRVFQLDPRRSDLLPFAAQTYISIGDWKSAETTYQQYKRVHRSKRYDTSSIGYGKSNTTLPNSAL